MTRLCPFKPKGLAGRRCRAVLVELGTDSDGINLWACRECKRIYAQRQRGALVIFDRNAGAPDA